MVRTRMLGGVGGAASRGVPILSRSIPGRPRPAYFCQSSATSPGYAILISRCSVGANAFSQSLDGFSARPFLQVGDASR